jgi:hypothetical protein
MFILQISVPIATSESMGHDKERGQEHDCWNYGEPELSFEGSQEAAPM